MQDGYLEASKIDEIISQLIEEHGVTPKNSIEWLKFARTIKTSVEIIEKVAEAAFKTKLSLKDQMANDIARK